MNNEKKSALGMWLRVAAAVALSMATFAAIYVAVPALSDPADRMGRRLAGLAAALVGTVLMMAIDALIDRWRPPRR